MSSKLHLVAAPQVDPVEEELAKDIWDVRRIPGACYSAHMSHHLLNFTHISAAFRPTTKCRAKSTSASNIPSLSGKEDN